MDSKSPVLSRKKRRFQSKWWKTIIHRRLCYQTNKQKVKKNRCTSKHFLWPSLACIDFWINGMFFVYFSFLWNFGEFRLTSEKREISYRRNIWIKMNKFFDCSHYSFSLKKRTPNISRKLSVVQSHWIFCISEMLAKGSNPRLFNFFFYFYSWSCIIFYVDCLLFRFFSLDDFLVDLSLHFCPFTYYFLSSSSKAQ